VSKSKDGGPAFAFANGNLVSTGMTLRDYFAAAALHGITNLPSVGQGKLYQWSDEWAEWSYSIADAMLKQRSKRPKE
jgi:hypothetical protein